MTITTDTYTAAAGQARQATEKSVDVLKNVAQAFTTQFDATKLPPVDLTTPVTWYFENLQTVIDVNRDLVTRWAELFTTFSGSVREQAHQVAGIVQDQTKAVAELATHQAEKLERAANKQADELDKAERSRAHEAEQAERAEAREAKRVEREAAQKAEQQANEAEEAEKAKVREAKRVEREDAKKAAEQAREPYEGMSKAELSDLLVERGLPKTGNIEDLIERLVNADNN